MNILKEIVNNKRNEVAERKNIYPIPFLQKSEYYNSPCVSLSSYVRRSDKTGIIAEFKRKSPSEGVINAYADIKAVTMGYMQSGASALSILTDNTYFGGSLEDLQKARQFNFCPILRKDFIIDEYMIHESRSAGADAILLIASILDKNQIKEYIELAHELDMEVLLEFHTEHEIAEKYVAGADCLGINHRDLHSMDTSLQNSRQLLAMLPSESVKIAESGIHSVADVIDLKKAGFNGFLIGTGFMKTSHPHLTCQRFSRTLFEETELNLEDISSGVLGI